MSACYLDASALVKLATPEAESAVLRHAMSRYATRFTSRVAEVEVARALARRSEASAALVTDVRVAFEGLVIVELEGSIASLAGSIAPPTLRTLDAIHLASAMVADDELEAFVTYDIRLADAARAAGLQVVVPA